MTLDYTVQCARVGRGGQNLGHLRFFFNKSVLPVMSFCDTMIIFRHSYSCTYFNGKLLPSLNDYWGKHCALITSVDKPSRVGQLKPYPTPPHPSPPQPHPTHPPHPTLSLPYPIPLPYPHPTSTPYPSPTPTPPLPYHTLPYKHGKPSF